MNTYSQDPSSPSPSASSSSSSNPRKRPRTSESSSEDKREARAQRNRIAAQESRDRRKREFTELHDRVAQLEAENAALRRTGAAAGNMNGNGNERTERLERENAELLERVSRLEAALTSVMPLIQSARGPSSPRPTPTEPTFTPTFIPSPSPVDPSLSLTSTTKPAESEESTRHLAAGGLFFTDSAGTNSSPDIDLDFPTLTPDNDNNTPCSPSSSTSSLTATNDEPAPANLADVEFWLRAFEDSASGTNTSTTNDAPTLPNLDMPAKAADPASTTEEVNMDHLMGLFTDLVDGVSDGPFELADTGLDFEAAPWSWANSSQPVEGVF